MLIYLNQNQTEVLMSLSVIIVGCGRVAVKHLKSISKLNGLELKGVVDTNSDSAKRLLASVKVLQIPPFSLITRKRSIRSSLTSRL